MEPCYTFTITYHDTEHKPSTVAEDCSTISVSGIQQVLQENTEWWNGWIQSFLEASSKHFSKPYTVQHIHKITKHHLEAREETMFPATITFHPQTIQIRGGVFYVNWAYHSTPITIDIPDCEEEVSLPVSSQADINEVQELNGEEVPIDPNATGDTLVLDTPTKFYDKNKVKEARLKAKIAMYRAQNQLNRYYEKYGTDVTDSDTDGETSDEEEEIQL